MTTVFLSALIFPAVVAREAVEVRFNVIQTNFFLVHTPGKAESATEMKTEEKKGSWEGRCLLSDGKWVIETGFAPGVRNTYVYDGTNVVRTTVALHTNTKISEKLKNSVVGRVLASASEKTNLAGLTITPGEQPLHFFGVNLPWLAFCSGRYLSSPNREMPLFGAEIRHVPWSFGFVDRTRRFAGEFGLPLEVELVASPKLLQQAVIHKSLLRGGKNSSDLHNALQPSKVFPEGFLISKYRVITSTNFAGLELPTEFIYEQFNPHASGNGTTRTLCAVGLVTAINHSSESITRIQLSRNLTYPTTDYRFRSDYKMVDEINYRITNGLIPEVINPHLQMIYKRRLESAPIDPVVKARYGIYGLFAALIVVPVLAVVFGRRQLQKRNKVESK